jgi:hypothetical protein
MWNARRRRSTAAAVAGAKGEGTGHAAVDCW